MIAAPGEARVLVASDAISEANQIVGLLEEHFSQVFASTSRESAVRDFETRKPDVLVLAFDGIAKAQSYYLGLYRLGQTLHPHRTVLLCSKEELPEAFALCKQQCFDDYVLYWPFAHDGMRLPMSIWIAAREMMAPTAQAGTGGFSQRPISGEAAGRIPVDTDATPERADRPLLMVVDDDEMTRDLLAGALRGTEYEILAVGDSAEALHELRLARPAVIFMDIHLPGLDGVSLTRRLKASPELAQIPVVMMTGDSRRETVTSSIEAGAADFLAKPFTRETLLAKLQTVLPMGAPA